MIFYSSLTNNLTNLDTVTIYHTLTTITTGTLSYEEVDYPDGFTQDNSFVERFEIVFIEGPRGGEDITNGYRVFYVLASNKIRFYSNLSMSYPIRLSLSKRTTTDITL